MIRRSKQELTRILVRGYISDRKFLIELAGVGGFLCLVLATLYYLDHRHDKLKADIVYFVGLLTINVLLLLAFERHKSRRKNRPEPVKLKEAIQIFLGDEEAAVRIVKDQDSTLMNHNSSFIDPDQKAP